MYSYRIRIRNSLKSRIRIRDRIRNKSFRIHNTAINKAVASGNGNGFLTQK
jgi:hypothetical protein